VCEEYDAVVKKEMSKMKKERRKKKTKRKEKKSLDENTPRCK